MDDQNPVVDQLHEIRRLEDTIIAATIQRQADLKHQIDTQISENAKLNTKLNNDKNQEKLQISQKQKLKSQLEKKVNLI